MKPTRILPIVLLAASVGTAAPRLSGIYPHLAYFNDEGECGTGAVVPWADRLWWVTYAPHSPKGSSDKLYSLTPDLKMTIHPESIGGTPANRMIHRESNQLFIGPHVIAADGTVRTIPYAQMFGRPTGTARHLTDPAGKVLTATMEEGIYEIDVKTLKVTELWGDEANKRSPIKAHLPGYHGKGFYSGQGVYVYANNGEHGSDARSRPEVPSGVLAEWDGEADSWTIVRRNQFTEVTGPGGIEGNANPATDPIWAVGWDHKSLLLGTRMPETGWNFVRLPKASHSYDGAHGWNTEWPRIRDIGESDLLMTMHGTFWKFPRGFRPGAMAGIKPRSNYLKVIGDFTRWNNEIVFGCDDTAKSEFLNKRKAKGEIPAPRSQSNLWFVPPADLDRFGPAIGRGAVWLDEAVAAGVPSEPFLFSGYDRRALHLHHDGAPDLQPVITLLVDKSGNGQWTALDTITMKENYLWVDLSAHSGEWIRLKSSVPLAGATAWFHFSNADQRGQENDPIFRGLVHPDSEGFTGGLIRARDNKEGTLVMAAKNPDGSVLGDYEMDAALRLAPADETGLLNHTPEKSKIPAGILAIESSSVLFIDDAGRRWRLPKGPSSMDNGGTNGTYRVAREVATERDLFHAHGTFYELPAENAGGFAKLRPVSTHHLPIHDFCSFRGLFIISGVSTSAPADNPHIIRSTDGKTALWAGAIDDIWKLGKPRGTGGPWDQSRVKAGQASDPYLMTGYDKKSLELTTTSPATLTMEIDVAGTGHWVPYRKFEVDGKMTHDFPDAFQAYWVRFVSDRDTTATARLDYR